MQSSDAATAPPPHAVTTGSCASQGAKCAPSCKPPNAKKLEYYTTNVPPTQQNGCAASCFFIPIAPRADAATFCRHGAATVLPAPPLLSTERSRNQDVSSTKPANTRLPSASRFRQSRIYADGKSSGTASRQIVCTALRMSFVSVPAVSRLDIAEVSFCSPR